MQVQEIGGHILGNLTHVTGHPELSFYGTLFGAIIPLSGPTALPVGDPSSLDALASTTFTAPFPSEDVLVPLSVSVQPGYYGLLFGGSGLFGSTGEGAMPGNNTDIPGNVSFFNWTAGVSNPKWMDEPFLTGYRFVINGTTVSQSVPDTGSTLSLLALGLIGVLILPRKMFLFGRSRP